MFSVALALTFDYGIFLFHCLQISCKDCLRLQVAIFRQHVQLSMCKFWHPHFSCHDGWHIVNLVSEPVDIVYLGREWLNYCTTAVPDAQMLLFFHLPHSPLCILTMQVSISCTSLPSSYLAPMPPVCELKDQDTSDIFMHLVSSPIMTLCDTTYYFQNLSIHRIIMRCLTSLILVTLMSKALAPF